MVAAAPMHCFELTGLDTVLGKGAMQGDMAGVPGLNNSAVLSNKPPALCMAAGRPHIQRSEDRRLGQSPALHTILPDRQNTCDGWKAAVGSTVIVSPRCTPRIGLRPVTFGAAAD
ncbi:MAG TPA: hypothetical protein VMB34_08035 [Acetobacteraceae bacterium]|nr:hypothetical protein [Acetobacteraceae bacterium]